MLKLIKCRKINKQIELLIPAINRNIEYPTLTSIRSDLHITYNIFKFNDNQDFEKMVLRMFINNFFILMQLGVIKIFKIEYEDSYINGLIKSLKNKYQIEKISTCNSPDAFSNIVHQELDLNTRKDLKVLLKNMFDSIIGKNEESYFLAKDIVAELLTQTSKKIIGLTVHEESNKLGLKKNIDITIAVELMEKVENDYRHIRRKISEIETTNEYYLGFNRDLEKKIKNLLNKRIPD